LFDDKLANVNPVNCVVVSDIPPAVYPEGPVPPILPKPEPEKTVPVGRFG
jgi:hypothetical protein